ncbi:hypothetical protein [Myceligenerans halotolerans]
MRPHGTPCDVDGRLGIGLGEDLRFVRQDVREADVVRGRLVESSRAIEVLAGTVGVEHEPVGETAQAREVRPEDGTLGGCGVFDVVHDSDGLGEPSLRHGEVGEPAAGVVPAQALVAWPDLSEPVDRLSGVAGDPVGVRGSQGLARGRLLRVARQLPWRVAQYVQDDPGVAHHEGRLGRHEPREPRMPAYGGQVVPEAVEGDLAERGEPVGVDEQARVAAVRPGTRYGVGRRRFTVGTRLEEVLVLIDTCAASPSRRVIGGLPPRRRRRGPLGAGRPHLLEQCVHLRLDPPAEPASDGSRHELVHLQRVRTDARDEGVPRQDLPCLGVVGKVVSLRHGFEHPAVEHAGDAEQPQVSRQPRIDVPQEALLEARARTAAVARLAGEVQEIRDTVARPDPVTGLPHAQLVKEFDPRLDRKWRHLDRADPLRPVGVVPLPVERFA